MASYQRTTQVTVPGKDVALKNGNAYEFCAELHTFVQGIHISVSKGDCHMYEYAVGFL